VGCNGCNVGSTRRPDDFETIRTGHQNSTDFEMVGQWPWGDLKPNV
jgi:hypothetical protein